jgi:hypothetical protein
MGWLVLGMLGIELWRRWREWKIIALRIIPASIFRSSELKAVCSNCELYGLSPCEDCIKLRTEPPDTSSSFPRSGVGTQLRDTSASMEKVQTPKLVSLAFDAAASSNCISVLEAENERNSTVSASEKPLTRLEIFPHAPWFVALTGLMAGFSTFVANAAMPMMSVYLISQGFNKREFLGTAAWFFFLLNLSKTPVYGSMGMFQTWLLPFDICLVVPVLVGSLLGVLILRFIPQKTFNALALLLAGVAAIRLIIV